MSIDYKKLDDHEIVVKTTTLNGKETAQAFTKDQLNAMATNIPAQTTAQIEHINVQGTAQLAEVNTMLALLTP